MHAQSSIFRIMGLHDLVNMLEDNQLRLRKAEKMEDKNEIIGFYFSIMTSGLFTRASEQSMRDSLHSVQSATYITSWSPVQNDIALWSLYSTDYNGVQIEVNCNQLRDILYKYQRENSYAKAYNLEPNDPRVLIRACQFGSVEYCNLQQEFETCSRLIQKQRKFVAENYDKANFSELLQTWREGNLNDFQYTGKSFLIKGNQYKHEKEIRGTLQICQRDGRTTEEYEAHPMASLDDPAKIIPHKDCPENLYIPIPKGFVQSIKLDSRLPEWKRAAVEKILTKYGIKIEVCEAFTPQYDQGKWFQQISQNLS